MNEPSVPVHWCATRRPARVPFTPAAFGALCAIGGFLLYLVGALGFQVVTGIWEVFR